MVRSRRHLSWVASLPCSVPDCRSGSNVAAHHVRNGTGGGMGKKPSDEWTAPLCNKHHNEGHQIGWRTFEQRYGVDLRAVALELAGMSPFLGDEDTKRRAAEFA